MRRSRTLEAGREEHRAPAQTVVAARIDVVVLPRHAVDYIAEAAPAIEAAVWELKLGSDELGSRREAA